jgi:hypothetical protein
MILWKTKGTEIYQQLAADCLLVFKECSPLDAEEENRKVIAQEYRNWSQSKKGH